MKNTKTFKLVMLHTEKANVLHKGQLWTHNNGGETKLHQWTSPDSDVKKHELQGYCIPQHLYILSDDEIKEGDWYLDGENNLRKRSIESNHKLDKKIVATTDKSLTLKSKCTCTESEAIYCGGSKIVGKCQQLLPQIPESFIQAYIKAYNEGKPITEVDLEMEEHQDYIWNDEGDTHSLSIKTRPDNTVIIHQSKLYTKEQTVVLCLKMQHDYSKYKKDCHYGPNLREIAEWTNKWIEDNL